MGLMNDTDTHRLGLWFDPLTHTLEESHIDRFEVASASYVLCHCVDSECT
jgi:hypothetical protein